MTLLNKLKKNKNLFIYSTTKKFSSLFCVFLFIDSVKTFIEFDNFISSSLLRIFIVS